MKAFIEPIKELILYTWEGAQDGFVWAVGVEFLQWVELDVRRLIAWTFKPHYLLRVSVCLLHFLVDFLLIISPKYIIAVPELPMSKYPATSAIPRNKGPPSVVWLRELYTILQMSTLNCKGK